MARGDQTGSHVTVKSSGTQQDSLVPMEQRPVRSPSPPATNISSIDLVNLSSQLTGMDILQDANRNKARKSKKRVRFNIPEKTEIQNECVIEATPERKILTPFKRKKTILVLSKRTLEYCSPVKESTRNEELTVGTQDIGNTSNSKDDVVVVKKKRKTLDEPLNLNTNNSCNVPKHIACTSGSRFRTGSGDFKETVCLNTNYNCDICRGWGKKVKPYNATPKQHKQKVKFISCTTRAKISSTRAKQSRNKKGTFRPDPLLDLKKRYVFGTNKRLIMKILGKGKFAKQSGRFALRKYKRKDFKYSQKSNKLKVVKRDTDKLNFWKPSDCPCRRHKLRNRTSGRKRTAGRQRHGNKKKRALKTKTTVKKQRIQKKRIPNYRSKLRKKRLGKRSRKIPPIEREEDTAEDLRVNLLKHLTIQFAMDHRREKGGRFRCCWRNCWRKWEELEIDDVYADFE